MLNNFLKDLNDEDLNIFNEEISNFLPVEIINSHVHLWKKDFFKENISKNRLNQNPALDSGIIDGFTIGDFKEIK